MKIFDAHIHTLFYLKRMYKTAAEAGTNFSPEGLVKEMKENNIVLAAAITNDRDDETPLSLNYILNQTKENKNLVAVCGVNPNKITSDGLRKLEESIKSGRVKGIKIYLGYYLFYPQDSVYDEVYQMAENLSCPVIFHAGDIADKKGLVKFAHPLNIDEIAVKYPLVNFIIAHAGNPWIMDAAELAYKNDNVFIDLSGLHVGNQVASKKMQEKLQAAYEYVGNPEKFIYGSDWPYVKMKTYIAFINKVIPAKDRSKVFFENAKKLFRV